MAAVAGLAVPQAGVALSGGIGVFLALLMLVVSTAFDVAAVRAALARPGVLLLATVLVYGPMSVAGWALGRLVFADGALGVGMVLVGVLPTDVSSPLLVLLARGNVALATVCNAVNTALAPLLVPVLFLAYTGVDLDVSVVRVGAELAATVLLPTVVGVGIRTRLGDRLDRVDPALSATAALVYLALVVAVVGPNAEVLRASPSVVVVVAAVALVLNVTGYGLAAATRPLLPVAGDRAAMLFTVSKKEFSVAAFVVASAGLPAEVGIPAVVYAVVQMITSPAVARRLSRQVP